MCKTYNNNTLDKEITLIHRNAYNFFCSLIIVHSYSAVLDSSCHSSHPRKLQLQDLITELENVKTILSTHYILTVYAPQRWLFRKLEGVMGTGWSWLRIGTGGGHLWVW
jgi:hypothetical protein